jgi:DUF4097 and DUF4098 domain-containing protein YvlB
MSDIEDKERTMTSPRRRIRTILAAAAALFVLAAGPAGASERNDTLLPGARNVQSRTFNKTAACEPGSLLKIDLSQAQLSITAWDKKEVSVEAKVEVGEARDEAVKEFLDNTSLILERAGSGLALRLDSPRSWEKGRKVSLRWLGDMFRRQSWKLSYAAQISVRVPASLSLEARNSFGNVEIRGLSGRMTVNNESGRVTVEGGGGSLDIDNSFGSVRAAAFKGGVDIRCESGAVELDDVAGPAVVKNSFKPVAATNVKGHLQVISESSLVTAADIGGWADIKTSFQPVLAERIHGWVKVQGESSAVTLRAIDGDAAVASSYQKVDVSRVGGTLTIDSESAPVVVNDVKRSADIQTSFGGVEVRTVGGTLKASGESCSVLAEDIGGAVDVHNSFKSIILRRVPAQITVVGESSPVDISQLKAPIAGGLISVRTSLSPITLTVPAGTGIQGSAKSEFGKIVTDFPVYLREARNEDSQTVEFGAGPGGLTLKLETSGPITIKKAS